MWSIMVLGFITGMKHALEADHLAALAALVSEGGDRNYAMKQGLAWGLGHFLTLFAFGGIVLIAESAIPENLANGLELVVGVMLVVLGLNVLYQWYKSRVHLHPHEHADGTQHLHAHGHDADGANHERHQHLVRRGLPLRALLIGLVHGLAGTAILIMLTLQAVDSVWLGLGYIALFGVGSLIGMALLSVVIAYPLSSTQHLKRTHAALQVTVALGTIGLGIHVGWSSALMLQ